MLITGPMEKPVLVLIHSYYVFCSEIFDEEKYRLEEEMQRDNRRVISWGRYPW